MLLPRPGQEHELARRLSGYATVAVLEPLRVTVDVPGVNIVGETIDVGDGGTAVRIELTDSRRPIRVEAVATR